MEVNGFQLPTAFVHLCDAIRRGEMPAEWALKEKADAYGQPWSTAGLIILSDAETMSRETAEMEWMFREDDRLQHGEQFRNQPGFIQDFTGVSNYVQFGRSVTGETYCFDFGNDSREPSVVTWPDSDCYWRRVAPNFTSFIALFVDAAEIEPFDPTEEEWEYVPPSPPMVFKAWAIEYVQSTPENRPIFEVIAGWYIQSSETERLEAEEEIRRQLESHGMSDKQRRTLENLFVRLRAYVARCYLQGAAGAT